MGGHGKEMNLTKACLQTKIFIIRNCLPLKTWDYITEMPQAQIFKQQCKLVYYFLFLFLYIIFFNDNHLQKYTFSRNVRTTPLATKQKSLGMQI